jgi:predicted O-methyltransferase YrrM
MRYATWMTIEQTPALHRLYRLYRRLPQGVRTPARWIAMPRWSMVAASVHLAAGDKVVAGPFAGTKLELAPVSSRLLVSYLLGTTELELHDIIERIVSKDYGTIINVGAADGYYAIGLARRMPHARVIAFEAQEQLHAGLLNAFRKNGVVGRITLRGRCDSRSLAEAIRESTGEVLILMDIEGGEGEALNPAVVPELAGVDVLVETHDVFVPHVTKTLIERFSPTHAIDRRGTRARTLADFPRGFLSAIPKFLPRTAVDIMNERRSGSQEWLYMVTD